MTACRRLGDRRGEASDHRAAWAAPTWLSGRFREAVLHHERHLAIAREVGDRDGEGVALGNLGSAHHALGDARGAIEFRLESLAIARERQNRREEGVTLGNLGLCYFSLGDIRKAIEFQQQSLAIAQ